MTEAPAPTGAATVGVLDIEKAIDSGTLSTTAVAALRRAWDHGHQFAAVVRWLGDEGYEVQITATADTQADAFAALIGADPPPETDDWPGSMVALYPDAATAEALSSPDMPPDDVHLTLAYLGDTPLSQGVMKSIMECVATCCVGLGPMAGTIIGGARLGGSEDPTWVALPEVPGLHELRADMVSMFNAWEIPFSRRHPTFVPHMSMTRAESPPAVPIGHEVTFSEVRCVFGTESFAFPLAGPDAPDVQEGESETDGDIDQRVPSWEARKASAVYDTGAELAKATREKRFTLSPWYVPHQPDAHDEWTDPDTLQEAAWGYVDHGDRRIRLQHDRAVVAGRMVEIVSWPQEVTLTLTRPGGEPQTVTFPVGTVFVGVLWEPWAWELVRQGRVLGMSMGGGAIRVDLPLEG